MTTEHGDRLAALRVLDPAAWRAQVRAALEAERSRRGAAVVLGVSLSTVQRWTADDPSLLDGIDTRTAGRPKPSRIEEASVDELNDELTRLIERAEALGAEAMAAPDAAGAARAANELGTLRGAADGLVHRIYQAHGLNAGRAAVSRVKKELDAVEQIAAIRARSLRDPEAEERRQRERTRALAKQQAGSADPLVREHARETLAWLRETDGE